MSHSGAARPLLEKEHKAAPVSSRALLLPLVFCVSLQVSVVAVTEYIDADQDKDGSINVSGK